MLIPSFIILSHLISLLYLEITKSNDTTAKNVFLFTSFYVIILHGAYVVGIDPNVVTTAFITKTIFTLIDERIKRKPDEKK